MTKKDLIKWLEDEREKTLKNADKRYEKEMEAHTKELYEKIQLDKHAAQIFKSCKQLYSDFNEFIDALIPDVRFLGCYNRDLISILRHFSTLESTKEELIANLLDYTEQHNRIFKRYNELQKNINKNYDNVILNVKSIKNAKLGVQYLESIGFKDIKMEEKEEECTAVACIVNTDFLFVKED